MVLRQSQKGFGVRFFQVTRFPDPGYACPKMFLLNANLIGQAFRDDSMRLVNDEGEIDLETNAKQSFANKCVPKQSLGTSGTRFLSWSL